jgi:hypothetical protein
VSGDLEEKIKALEKELQEIKEPLTSTLMDLRDTISELENPFNYLSKIVDKNEEEKKDPEPAQQKMEEAEKPAEPVQPKSVQPSESKQVQNVETLHMQNSEGNEPSPWHLQLNVLVVTDTLLRMFGRDGLKRVVAEYVKDGWITREVARAVDEAMAKLAERDSIPEYAGKAGLEEHLLALYVLYRLSSHPGDPLLPVLLLFLSKSRIERGDQLPPRLDGEWR